MHTDAVGASVIGTGLGRSRVALRSPVPTLRYCQAMSDSSISRAQLFLMTVPSVLGLATVALAASTVWPAAIATGAAAVGAGIWGRRMFRNEQADEALKDTLPTPEADTPDSST